MQIEQVLPADLLEQFPATKALKELGFNDGQLDQIQFHPKDRHLPIAQRPLRLPAILVSRWELSQNECPPVLSLLRDHLICRYALFGGLGEDLPDLAGAWQLISDITYAPLVGARLRYLDDQKSKAQKPRGVITEIGMSIRDFVIEYARKPENRSLKPGEMWPGFRSHMCFHRLDAKLVGEAYEYSIDKSIAYGTFCNYVREARKKKPQ